MHACMGVRWQTVMIGQGPFLPFSSDGRPTNYILKLCGLFTRPAPKIDATTVNTEHTMHTQNLAIQIKDQKLCTINARNFTNV